MEETPDKSKFSPGEIAFVKPDDIGTMVDIPSNEMLFLIERDSSGVWKGIRLYHMACESLYVGEYISSLREDKLRKLDRDDFALFLGRLRYLADIVARIPMEQFLR